MAGITVTRPDMFPVATSVSAYLIAGQIPQPASGPPPGSAAATEVVESDGSLAFTGLTEGASYWLYAATPDRYLRVNTSPTSSGASLPAGGTTGEALVKASDADGDVEWGAGGEVSFADLEVALGDVLEEAEGWPTRPTLNGEAIPWPLRWRSLPGSVESPLAFMADFDEFLPVPAEE